MYRSFLLKFRTNLLYRLIALFTIPLLAIVIFGVIYYPTRQMELTDKFSNQQTQLLSEMLSFSVGAGLNDGNIDLVQTAFTWAKRDTSVELIAILDETGSPIVQHNPKNIEIDTKKFLGVSVTSPFGADHVLSSSPIVYAQKNFGTIVILYSLKQARADIRRQIMVSMLINFLLLAAGVYVVVRLTKVVTTDVKSLAAGAARVTDGDMNVSVKVASETEIGQLADSFNQMVGGIRKMHLDLKAEKEGVEAKVAEAVSEMSSRQTYLNTSVEDMLVAMERFSQGDLTVQLSVEHDDAIGRLFDGFNRSVENMRQMLSRVAEAIAATASASAQISSSTEEMAAGTQEQTHQTAEIAGAIEQMAKTIVETTRNAEHAAALSKQSGDNAVVGGTVVAETIGGMRRITAVVGQSAETVQTLGRSSDQIGEIVQVIDDIADQTNLLALNAAIEAARAGEQGRGFAVVADEVRKLAERTTKATKEIAGMIREIQKNTSGAVQSMTEGTSEVETGRVLAEKAGLSLQEIIDGAKNVTDMINTVAVANKEQSSAAEQISRNIEGIRNVTEETAAGIQQVAKASEDLNRLTQNLQDLLQQFRINENTPISSLPSITHNRGTL